MFKIPDSPEDPTLRDRSKNPHLLGDVFHSDHGDFTLFHIVENVAYGVLVQNDKAILKKINNWDNFEELGYTLNMEYVKKGEGDSNWFGFRKLEDGSWACVTLLTTTSAIVCDINGLFFEKRYCFKHNDHLPSWATAVYWLARFKTADSQPIGNCAYRGTHGLTPIEDPITTQIYYDRLHQLKTQNTVDGFDITTIGKAAMTEIFEKRKSLDHLAA